MSVQKDLGEHKYWPFKSLKDKEEDEAVHLPNPLVDGEFIPHSNSHCIYLGKEQLVMCIWSMRLRIHATKEQPVSGVTDEKKKLYTHKAVSKQMLNSPISHKLVNLTFVL